MPEISEGAGPEQGELETSLDQQIARLQAEADLLFPESTHGERDVWFNLQLVLVALQSHDPERINDAIQDAIMLAENYEREDIVAKLQTLLLE